MSQLSDIVNGFSTTPFLFVGSGLTRRYYNLPDWRGLLDVFAKKIYNDDFAYTRYENIAKTNYKVCLNSKIAELIERDFNKKWFDDPSIRGLDDYYTNEVIHGVSPFKAEIAMYIKNHSQSLPEYASEIEKFKQISTKSLSGIITTNYDSFLESTVDQYNTYIGQEELLFSAIQGLAEIYKIHGCITRPESLVIDEEDYIEFDNKSSYLAAKLMTIFMEYPIIFIGYSITDPDIQKILNSIVDCLSADNAQKLGDRFVFIDYKKGFVGMEVSSHTITFNNGKMIPMTKIKLDDFSSIYDALAIKKAKLPVKILRMFKQEFYTFTLTNTPTANLHVAAIDDSRIEDEDLVLAIGKASDFSLQGLRGITTNDWYRDIVMDDLKFSANDILETAYPYLISGNGKLPVNKHLSRATQKFPQCIKDAADNDFEHIISNTIKKNRAGRFIRHRSVSGILKDYAFDKSLQQIAYLRSDEIDVKELEEFLKGIFSKNMKFLSSAPIAMRTDLRRLIRIYDWLKYGKVKEP